MIDNLWSYYAYRARRLADRDNQLQQLSDAKAWEASRAEHHQQFMVSLGLGVLPARCDLKPVVTGQFKGQGYHAQKIAYQILPDVWASAHLYRPDSLPAGTKAPGVVYACGHYISGVIGYQEHAIAWARRGYACLIFDTIEQHDNPGEHHGLHAGRFPGWISMGYSSAGGEVFNGMRAMDLLCSQPDVDPARIGVTGISGGGSQSFRLAIADPRFAAVAPVAGISDPALAIADRHVQNHCDCFYEHNRFGHDISFWAALIAPRPLLLCFARHDQLFTPIEYQNVYKHVRSRYEKLGVAELCQLEEYDGQHGYNFKSTCDAIHNWFDTHVAREPHPQADTLAIATSGELHNEQTLSINHGQTPEPNRLDLLPELLSVRGQIPLPASADQWQKIKTDTIARLRSEVFGLIDDVQGQQTLSQCGDWTHEGTDRLAWRGELDGMEQWVVQLNSPGKKDPAVVITIGDRVENIVHMAMGIRGGEELGKWDYSVMAVEPRAAGRRVFHPAHQTILNREGCLVGLTPAMVMVQDLHHLLPRLLELPTVKGRPVYLHGKNEGALAMLYYGLLHAGDQRIKGMVFEGLPWTHREGVHQILGVDNVLQIGQAAGLLAPLPVALVAAQTWGSWFWTSRAYERLGCAASLYHRPTLPEALRALVK